MTFKQTMSRRCISLFRHAPWALWALIAPCVRVCFGGGTYIRVRVCFSRRRASKAAPASHLRLRLFVLLRSLELFPRSFVSSFGQSFLLFTGVYLYYENSSVTTHFICGSCKAGNTAYFSHPLRLISFMATSTPFWESAFTQTACVLVHMCKGNYFYS